MRDLSLPLEHAEIDQATTFLFSDIEGSTRLWEQHPEAMAAALARHDALLRNVIETRGGRIFKTVGDGVYAAFLNARDAVGAAIAAQERLRGEDWGGLSLRVRMALHRGPAYQRDGDYFGPTLTRVARLLDAAHGEQILLSQAVRAELDGTLPAGVSLQNLGEHRLRDLAGSEPIFQVVVPDLPQVFPPLRSAEVFIHHFPLPLTRFIGRDREIGEVGRLLATTRLLTLAGPGGTGKSRLSVQVALGQRNAFPDGAARVELAALTDPALVMQTVAATLGVSEETRRPLPAPLIDYLQPRRLLLILDNCEHLITACAQIAETLLQYCPYLSILTTSREPLNIPGEVVWQVPPLSLPNPDTPLSGAALEQYEAVRLFVDRAAAVMPGFQLTKENGPIVAQICQRLDGIPLAIELAAARVRTLSVAQIAARLGDRFLLLTGGSRTAAPRQQTLRALIDWSYDLLDTREQAVLRRLAVFAGGWSVEGAEAVCADKTLRGYAVFDVLDKLVSKSLVVAIEQQGVARYHFLDTIRLYAREKLEAAGEVEHTRLRHLAMCIRLAEEMEPLLNGEAQESALRRLEIEHDNLRAALQWALESGEDEEAARLAGALIFFWVFRGHWTEGRRWLEAILEQGTALPAARRAKILRGAGMLANRQDDHAPAAQLNEQALALFRALGDKHGVASTLAGLGWLAYSQQDYARARPLYEEAIALFRQWGDKISLADCLGQLAQIVQEQGDFPQARALIEESLTLFRALDDKLGIAIALHNLGWVAMYQADYAQAVVLLEQSLALAQEGDYKPHIAGALTALGETAFYQGDFDQARTLGQRAITLWNELGNTWGIVECLVCLAATAAATSQSAHAVRLLAAASALQQQLDLALASTERELQEQARTRAAEDLDSSRFAAAWAEGQAWSLAEMVAGALKGTDEP